MYQRAIRFPTTRKTKTSHRFPFFVFQFWKITWKTILAYTLNLSKGQLFSERATNGKRILKQILFSILRKKVTLAQTSFGTSFSGVGSERSTPPPAFFYLTIRLRAWDFYEVIVDEGEARINYHLIEIESE